jgi:hypothetical protein
VLFRRENPHTRLMKRFRIIETTIRGESFFTVEYRTHSFFHVGRWEPVMLGDSFEDCERKINLIVTLKLSDE